MIAVERSRDIGLEADRVPGWAGPIILEGAGVSDTDAGFAGMSANVCSYVRRTLYMLKVADLVDRDVVFNLNSDLRHNTPTLYDTVPPHGPQFSAVHNRVGPL